MAISDLEFKINRIIFRAITDPLMDCRRAIFFLLLAFFGFSPPPAYAQFNLKTGYNFSILSNPELDRIVSSFSESQSYTSPFNDLRWVHGFEFGIRLKGGIHALELTYQGVSKTLKAKGDIPGSMDKYTDHLTFSIQSGAFGYQIGNRTFGLGTDLQYQMYNVKFDEGQTKASVKANQHMMAYKFYLMLTLHGNTGVDFSFQPYMVLPAKYYDLAPLSQILNTEVETGRDKWIRYGLTVLFYNGEK